MEKGEKNIRISLKRRSFIYSGHGLIGVCLGDVSHNQYTETKMALLLTLLCLYSEQSPNENIPQMSPNTNLPPTWERSAGGGGGPGLSWSPVMDEGHRSRPDMTRRDTASSNGEGSSSRLGGQSSLHRPAHRLSVMERTLVQVTEDNERFSVVDISGLNSAAAIKERMMSKLREF
jgi:hypothetical protein